jgi:hypothetical protein
VDFWGGGVCGSVSGYGSWLLGVIFFFCFSGGAVLAPLVSSSDAWLSWGLACRVRGVRLVKVDYCSTGVRDVRNLCKGPDGVRSARGRP